MGTADLQQLVHVSHDLRWHRAWRREPWAKMAIMEHAEGGQAGPPACQGWTAQEDARARDSATSTTAWVGQA